MAQPAYLQTELWIAGRGWSTWFIYIWSRCCLERYSCEWWWHVWLCVLF